MGDGSPLDGYFSMENYNVMVINIDKPWYSAFFLNEPISTHCFSRFRCGLCVSVLFQMFWVLSAPMGHKTSLPQLSHPARNFCRSARILAKSAKAQKSLTAMALHFNSHGPTTAAQKCKRGSLFSKFALQS